MIPSRSQTWRSIRYTNSSASLTEYARFLDLIRYIQPTQQQVDDLQKGRVLCPSGDLSDDQLSEAFASHTDTSIMMVSRRAVQRLNTLVVRRLFHHNPPLTNIPCASVLELEDIFPYRGMRIVITENWDKTSKIVNGHDTILVRFPDNGMASFTLSRILKKTATSRVIPSLRHTLAQSVNPKDRISNI